MSNFDGDLTPTPSWDSVPQASGQMQLLGGPGGPLNEQAQRLLNRTEFLREGVDAAQQDIDQFQAYLSSSDPTKGASLVQLNGYETVSQRMLQVFNAAAYGLKTTNTALQNTAALQALSAAVNAAGGGKIVLPAGVYRVGAQNFAGANGLGYAYQAQSMLSLANCTIPVVIEAFGAVFKVADGLKFGSFDPVTGAAYTPTMPFTNQNYGADIGSIFNFQNCGHVTIHGGELDGNQANIVLGGQWGDVGYQRIAYGVRHYGCQSFTWFNGYTHHHGTDGGVSGYAGLVAGSPATPVVLINVRSEYNARQAWSWVGGVSFTAIGCKFSNTGKGTFGSAPGAGFDVEAESSVCRRGHFINCEFANNTGYAMVADSGDSADLVFDGCLFFGSTQNALWPRKPRITFRSCTIVGAIVNAYAATSKVDRVKFVDCYITNDLQWNGITSSATQLMDVSSSLVDFQRCTFNAVGGARLGNSTNGRYTDCNFIQNGSAAVSTIRGWFFGECSFAMITGSNDFAGPTITSVYGPLAISGSVASISVSDGYAFSTALQVMGEKMFANSGAGARLNSRTKSYQIPTTGTYLRGDIVEHANPAASGFIGWVCVASGTAGTLNGGATTGSITTGTNSLTVSTAAGLSVGQFLAVAGAVTSLQITAIAGTTVTLSGNATATVSGAAVSFVNPTFKTYGAISA